MKKLSFLITLLLFLFMVIRPVNLSGINSNDTRMLTQPAISANHIAFIYAEDLWIANPDGSQPRRLTIDEGIESDPYFSPDGSLIAFSAQYYGNRMYLQFRLREVSRRGLPGTLVLTSFVASHPTERVFFLPPSVQCFQPGIFSCIPSG